MAVKTMSNTYLSPVIGETLANGLTMLGYQWFNHQINGYTKFNMENVSIHRTENDIVSQLSSKLHKVTTHANPGFKYNILDNHRMDYLAEKVKELYGMEHLKIEELPIITIKKTITDINKYALNSFWDLGTSRPHSVYNERQILGQQSIQTQSSLIRSSRNSWRKNINKFNILI